MKSFFGDFFRKKKRTRIIALVMVFVLAITIINWENISKANEENMSDIELEEEQYADFVEAITDATFEEYEIVEERTTNSTTYQLADGYKETIFYASDVRYSDENGELVDYDPTLKKINDKKHKGYLYKNSVGDKDNYIPNEINEDTPVLMNSESYSIGVAPSFEGSKKENEFAKVDSLEKVDIIKEDVEDLYENVEEKITTATYEAEDESFELQYESQSNGVKENIILNEKPSTNVWKFEISLDSELEPKKDKCCEGISFFKRGTDEIVGGIQKPYMDDATGNNYSESITYDIEEKKDENNKYILTMTVDENYLSSPSTVYPVTIDPTYTWTGSSTIYDVYVISGSTYGDTNFYSSSVGAMYAGKNSNGILRTYISFNGLASKISGKSISSAKLSLYETGAGKSGMTVQAYQVSSSYTKTSLTWNNRPGYSSTLLGSFTSTATTNNLCNLTLTSYAKKIANGSNDYGIILKTSSESTTGDYTKFYGSRTTSSYKPKLAVVYYDKPTQPTSVTVDSTYIKKGDTITVNWAGVNSASLRYVEYCVKKYDMATSTVGDTYKSYTSMIGGASGSYEIAKSAEWDEGEYIIYLRGYDNYNSVGPEKGVFFAIDGTNPIISKATITSSSSTAYSSQIPSVTWSVTEEHMNNFQYSVNGGSYVTLSTSKSGTAKLEASYFDCTGKYTIRFRAVDKAGNTSAVSTAYYYYDAIAPEMSVAINPLEVSNEKNPILSWSIVEDNLKSLVYNVNDGTNTELENVLVSSYQIPDGIIVDDGTYKFNIIATDYANNIITKTVEYQYDATAPSYEGVVLLPETSEDNYSKELPILSWSGLADNNNASIVYQVSFNGEKILDETTDLQENDIQFSKDIFVNTGNYEISVYAIDSAGNKTENYVVNYYYDGTAPEISNDRFIKDEKKVVMSVKEDFALNNEIYYTIVKSDVDDIKDATVLDRTATLNKDSEVYSFNLTESDMDLDDGVYNIFAAVKDTTGNFSEIKKYNLFNFYNAKYDSEFEYYFYYWDEQDRFICEINPNEEINKIDAYIRKNKGDFEYYNTYDETTEQFVITEIDNIEYIDFRLVVYYDNGETILTGHESYILTELYEQSLETENTDETIEDEEVAEEVVETEDVTEENSEETVSEGETSEDVTEESSEEEKSKYTTQVNDTDGDGLSDTNEMWELNTDINGIDTDNDGISDFNEISILGTMPSVYNNPTSDMDNDGITDLDEFKNGTNPTLADSDFDGLNDAVDSEPLKTDITRIGTADYSVLSKITNYCNKEITYNSNNEENFSISNIYDGNVRQTYNNGEYVNYFYDNALNVIAVIRKSGDTYTYNTYKYNENGNVEYITQNDYAYELEYTDNGNLKDVKIAGNDYVTNTYLTSDDGSELKTREEFANNDSISYEYVTDSENIQKLYINDSLAYEIVYDEETSKVVKIIDNIKNEEYNYSYNEDGELIEFYTLNSGFSVKTSSEETTETIDEESYTKTIQNEVYSYNGSTKAIDTVTYNNSLGTEKNKEITIDNAFTYTKNEEKKYVESSISNKDNTVSIITAYDNSTDKKMLVTHSDGEVYEYYKDDNDNIIKVVFGGNTVVSYEYDNFSQLKRENNLLADKTILYNYDVNGNILSRKVYKYTLEIVPETELLKSYTYSYASDRLISFNNEEISYDNIGNPEKYIGGYSFDWTGRILTKANYGQTEIEFTYDKDGYRTSATVNGIKTNYEWYDGKLIAEETEGKTLWYLYDDKDIIGFQYNDNMYFYGKNEEGDIIKIYDEQGILVVEYLYDSWGNILMIDGDEELASINPFRYKSYYYDDTLGFYYLLSRYYDPGVGRFINGDDISCLVDSDNTMGAKNPYTYCNNNPVNKSDPSGFKSYVNVGFGLFLSLTFGVLSVGLDVLFLTNKGGLKLYIYYGFAAGFQTLYSIIKASCIYNTLPALVKIFKNTKLKAKNLKSIAKQIGNITSTNKASIKKALQSAGSKGKSALKKLKAYGAIGVYVLSATSKNYAYSDYKGRFNTSSIQAANIITGKATGSSRGYYCKSYSVAWAGSPGWDVNSGISYYDYVSEGPFKAAIGLFKELKSTIKNLKIK